MDIQVFLRFTNFYCKFIYGFLNIVFSLFNITSTSTIWVRSSDQQHIFTTLKTVIIIALVLVSLDTSVSFKIKVDSLEFAARAVIFQQSKKDNCYNISLDSIFL